MVQIRTEPAMGPNQRVFDEIRTALGTGSVPSVFRAMAAVGADVLVQNWTAFRQTFLDGELPRSLKEMIGLTVSLENRCPYFVAFHSARLGVLGVPPDHVQGLVGQGDAEDLPESIRAILSYVRRFAGSAASAACEDLEAIGLSHEEALEVVDTLLMVEGLNRFAAETGLTVEV